MPVPTVSAPTLPDTMGPIYNCATDPDQLVARLCSSVRDIGAACLCARVRLQKAGGNRAALGLKADGGLNCCDGRRGISEVQLATSAMGQKLTTSRRGVNVSSGP